MTEFVITDETANNAVHPSLDRNDFISCFFVVFKIWIAPTRPSRKLDWRFTNDAPFGDQQKFCDNSVTMRSVIILHPAEAHGIKMCDTQAHSQNSCIVSVAMPVFNEPGTLATVLHAVFGSALRGLSDHGGRPFDRLLF